MNYLWSRFNLTLFLPFSIFALKKILPGNLIIQNWQERLIGRLAFGSRKEQGARERLSRGEAVPTWESETHKNRFPTRYPITCGRCVICQKVWQKTIDITQTKRAKALSIYILCLYKDPLGYLLIELCLINPYLCYGVCAWGSAPKIYWNKILLIQKWALRMIYFTDYKQHAV